ncbi:MAG: hypothetical protein U9P50_01905 [Patescibacteria group bacterium]|nr:hypothetical protein [Patescibacteria group bacterium]
MFFKKPKKIIFSILIALLFCSSNFFLTPQKTEAQWYVFDGANAALNALNNVTSAISAYATKYLALKEQILDGAAWILINVAIEKIADSTVDWINNGFEGGPGFITNFNDYLTDVGDQALGDFISGSPLAFLCSPFSLDIKIALALQFGSEREARCTLSDAFDNIDSAVDDLGNNWSWDQFSVLSQSRNNTYGAYAAAYTDVKLNIAGAKERQVTKGNWGGGMLSFESCEDDYEETDCETSQIEGECETYSMPGDCTTHTPGSLIEDTLADTLTSGTKRLLVADEINEIVGALLNQLVNTVLGDKGLLHGTPGETYGFTKIPVKIVGDLTDLINEAITAEEEWKNWKQQSLNIVTTAEAYLEALINCWEDYPGFPPADPPLSDNEIQAKINVAQQIINNTITPLKARLVIDVALARENIETLNLMLAEIVAATDPDTGEGDPTIISDIIDEFNSLTLHTESSVVLAEQEFHGPPTENGIESQMNVIINKANLDSTECTNGGGTFTPVSYSPLSPSCEIIFVPGNITPGGSSTLGWTSTNGTSGSIDNGVGNVPPANLEGWSTTISPNTTTTYTGTVVGEGGTSTCPAIIIVY